MENMSIISKVVPESDFATSRYTALSEADLHELVERAKTEWVGTSATYKSIDGAHNTSRQLRKRIARLGLITDPSDLSTRVWPDGEGRYEFALTMKSRLND